MTSPLTERNPSFTCRDSYERVTCWFGGLLLLRPEHHHHLPPFHERVLLDRGVRRQVVLHSAQQFATDFLVGHFAAAEAHGHLRLVPFLQEADQVAHLHLVVTL